MAMSDDFARSVREQWRVNLVLGFQQRMGWDADTPGRLAKAAGATPAQLSAWISGEVAPSTSQALAIMDALPLPRVGIPAEANGAAR